MPAQPTMWEFLADMRYCSGLCITAIMPHVPIIMVALLSSLIFFGPYQPLSADQKRLIISDALTKYGLEQDVKMTSRLSPYSERVDKVEKQHTGLEKQVLQLAVQVKTTQEAGYEMMKSALNTTKASFKTEVDQALSDVQTWVETMKATVTNLESDLKRVQKQSKKHELEVQTLQKRVGAPPRLNWALSSLGASIESASPAVNRDFWLLPLHLVTQYLGPEQRARMSLGTSYPPEIILDSDAPTPGKQFTSLLPAHVGVRFGLELAKVKGISIKHLPKELTPNRKSAPRNFRVIPNREHWEAANNKSREAASEKEVKEMGALTFTFGEELGQQYFPVNFADVQTLTFEFYDNYGAKMEDDGKFVSLYRIEVYGEDPHHP